MKVAIVHDDLMQWGGAEKVLLGISELFPDAPIYTLIKTSKNKLLNNFFKGKKIHTSLLQKLSFLYKPLFFLHPLSFEQFDFSDYDLVISQTTRFAKSIITGPNTLHLCYCHTPPRFLWNFSGDREEGWLQPLLSWLRIVDRTSAHRVDLFLAGSENAKRRIKGVYQKDSEVLLPFINMEDFQEVQGFQGNYFLIIARLTPYKRVDLAVEAFNKLGLPLKIVGDGPQMERLQKMACLPAGRPKPNIEFLGAVSHSVLINLIAGCKALIVTAEEDFGLTPLEAQAMGKPVIAYGKGGALETVIEKKTGLFFKEQTAESLVSVLREFREEDFSPDDCKKNAQRFSKQIFQQKLRELVKQANQL